jgi:hypothetical protein
MLQITPQMRILVAVEAVDFRKYAPSMDMRSSRTQDCENQALLRWKQRTRAALNTA